MRRLAHNGKHFGLVGDTHHAHPHIVCHQPATSSRLRFALILTATILAVELLGGIWSNSLALLSDAGHVLTDVIALALAWFAARQAERPATATKTFGFHRAGILAALANAATLVVIAFFITWEAIQRIREPEPVHSDVMLLIAVVGLLANLFVMRQLQGHDGHNLNVRSALLHVIGDALASAAVIVGGVIIAFTDWYTVDPVLSVLIALIIGYGSWTIIQETLNILMEGVPKGLSLDELLDDLRGVAGVRDLHDVHVWSLAAGLHSLSGHVVVSDQALSESDSILQKINELLECQYGISHTTLQLEHAECGLVCSLAANRSAS